MRTLELKTLITLAFATILLASGCGSKGGVSETTGWEYNNPDNGGFEVLAAAEQETGPGLVLVEGGTFVMGRAEQDVTYDWNNVPRRFTLASFYMDMTEVRNVDYREYLYWIERVFIEYPEVYTAAIPDTLVWRRPLAFNEPYVEYYFRHPAYNDYPVVGVSWKQAEKYCMWRTDRVNEKILIREKILDHDPNQLGQNNFNTDAYLVGQYEGIVLNPVPDLNPNNPDGRRVKMEDGILLPKYRLPTEAEWEYAAFALLGNSVDERIYSTRIFPWNGHFVRNDGLLDGKGTRGLMRANFQRGKGDMMGVAGYLNDNAAITAPVTSYWPNDFGLYCMAGNVNEWVLDVYRPLSLDDVDEFRPFRGNIFVVMDKDPATGVVKQKNKYGEIPYREMTEEECVNRENYRRANNRNYLDGDLRSTIVESSAEWNEGTEPATSDRMYYEGKGDKKLGMRSLINDHSRVYKGGGWRDRTYWLSPGTRRFLDEEKSRDDIGFRCAMIRVGSPTGY